MPFLIPAGIAIGSSILGSKLAKSKPTPLESQALGQTSQAGQLGIQTGQSLLPESAALRQRGAGLLDTAAQTAYPTANYWSTLLSGNRAGMTSLLAPELNRQAQGYQQAAQTSAALTPRGGPRADILADQPYQQQRDASTLFQTLRPQAASGLLDTSKTIAGYGGQYQQAGSNLLNEAMNSIFGGQGGRNAILNEELNRRYMDRQAGASIGSTIFDILKKIDFSKIGQSDKGTGPTVSSSSAGIFS